MAVATMSGHKSAQHMAWIGWALWLIHQTAGNPMRCAGMAHAPSVNDVAVASSTICAKSAGSSEGRQSSRG